MFYENYFKGINYLPNIKTRDLDFLVPKPSTMKQTIDIPELLRDLGFVVGFKGSKGYIKLQHPDLIVEFLVLEKGKGSDEPYSLPQLGVNAVGLRFLSFLSQNTILVRVKNLIIKLPHPANFALHKLIISQRRRNKEKAEKDNETARKILKALIDKGEINSVKKVFTSVPVKWQSKIINGLKLIKEDEIVETLKRKP
jgi:hypothetical protein